MWYYALRLLYARGVVGGVNNADDRSEWVSCEAVKKCVHVFRIMNCSRVVRNVTWISSFEYIPLLLVNGQ
jgi:hypothetical protein